MIAQYRRNRPFFWTALILLLSVYIGHFLYIWVCGYIRIFPYSDAQFYWNWARQICQGRFSAPFLGLPGYAFFLAAIYRFTHSIEFVVFLQYLMNVASGMFLFLSVSFLLDRYKVRYPGIYGLLGVIVYLFYTPFIMYASILSPESFAVFLFSILVYVFVGLRDGGGLGYAVLCGLLSGILVITRPVFGFWALVMSVYVPLRILKGYWLRKALWGVVYLLCLMIPVVMVLVINFRASGRWIISSHSGINFYIGNGPIATGIFYTGGRFRPTQSGMIEDARIVASKIEGRALTNVEASQFWTAKTMEYIADHPLRFLRMLGFKSLLLFNETEYHDANWQSMDIRILPFLSFAFIFPLALLSLWLTRRYPEIGIFRLALVLGFLATILVFVNTRYKMMVVLPAIYLFVFGLWQMMERIRAREYLYVSLYVMIMLALFVSGRHCWIDNNSYVVSVNYNRAMDLMESGMLSEARVLLERALKENPRDYLSWFALGNVFYREGNLDEARRCYLNSLKINPLYADALFNLGIICLDRGLFQEAEDAFVQLYQVSPFKADVVYNLMRAELGLGKCRQVQRLGNKLLNINANVEDEVKRVIEGCKAQ